MSPLINVNEAHRDPETFMDFNQEVQVWISLKGTVHEPLNHEKVSEVILHVLNKRKPEWPQCGY